MAVEFDIVSIGTLSHNPLWGEAGGLRTAHATTTLIRQDERAILVDPSLPAPALEARLFERTGKRFGDVTDVFCTTLRPTHRRAIEACEGARWWAAPAELETYRHHLEGLQGSAERLDADSRAAVEADLELIDRFQPAADRLGDQIHLFPLGGPSPGSAGLILTPVTVTIVIAGDAALTRGHVQAGRVWEGSADAETAMNSLEDVLEIADLIICGHDNIMLSPRFSM